MEFHIRNDYSGRSSENIGEPVLVYTGFVREEMSNHPRGPHAHQDMVEILLLLNQHGEFMIDGKIYEVGHNDLVIYDSGVLHDELVHGGPQISNLYCAATGIQIEGLPRNHLLPEGVDPVFHLGARGRTFRHLLQAMFDESIQESKRSLEISNALFGALLKMILNEIEDCQGNACAPPACGQLGERIKAYVNEHYLEPLTVQSVAEAFDISTSYLSHVFKKTTGQTLIQYVIRRRIGEAQTLLISTSKPVKAVAEQVGYDNTSYFNMLFSRNVGMPPLKYRKVYRNNEIQNPLVLGKAGGE